MCGHPTLTSLRRGHKSLTQDSGSPDSCREGDLGNTCSERRIPWVASVRLPPPPIPSSSRSLDPWFYHRSSLVSGHEHPYPIGHFHKKGPHFSQGLGCPSSSTAVFLFCKETSQPHIIATTISISDMSSSTGAEKLYWTHYLSRYKLFLHFASSQITRTKVYWIWNRFFATVLTLAVTLASLKTQVPWDLLHAHKNMLYSKQNRILLLLFPHAASKSLIALWLNVAITCQTWRGPLQTLEDMQ